MKSEYGERLKIFRKSLGLSLDKFANRIGVSKATMINYEKGGTIPNIELISRMVTEFNLNFNWLITGKNESMIKKKDLMSVIPCLEKFDEETITSITETLMELFETIGNDKEHSLKIKDIPLVLEILKALSNRFVMLTISKEIIFAEQEFKDFKSKQSSGFAVQG